jgi:acyl carrier protein
VDRPNLPIPDQERFELENAFVLPRSPIEELLVEMWLQILGLNQVGIHDDFFELGGHSLLATRLISWIRRDFNVEFSIRELFELPTVSGLALAIVKRQIEQKDSNNLAQLLEELERFPIRRSQ